MSDADEMCDVVPDRLRALLTAAFTDARNKACEELSPWTPEGFAVIACAALSTEIVWRETLEAERVRTAQLTDALRKYGRHNDFCAYATDMESVWDEIRECDCGFSQAWNALVVLGAVVGEPT